jgi:hypothetical protein
MSSRKYKNCVELPQSIQQSVQFSVRQLLRYSGLSPCVEKNIIVFPQELGKSKKKKSKAIPITGHGGL